MKKSAELIQTKQVIIDKLQTSSDLITNEIKKLQEKILEVGGVRLRSQQSKVDGLHDQLLSLNTGVTSIKVERAVRERGLQKIIKSFGLNETQLNKIIEEVSTMIAEYKEQSTTSNDIKERLNSAKTVSSFVFYH